MRSEGFSFNFGGLRVELHSLVVVFVSATVRNRSQPSATARNRPQVFESGSYGPAVGESSKKWLFMDVSRVSAPLICIKVVCHARKVMHFAAQAQGFWKWHVCVVVILGFAVSERCFNCWITLLHWDLPLQGGLKSSVFVTSLRSNVDFEESV